MAMIGKDIDPAEAKRNVERWRRLEEEIKRMSCYMDADKARTLAWQLVMKAEG